jgi:hypothetical protein
MAKWSKMKPVTYIALGAVAGLIITYSAEGASQQPGSAEDPLVTKSYVDQQVARLVKEELAKAGGGAATAGAEMTIVNVANHQRLMAAAGTEVIVRTGKAVAYVTDGTGISDVTDGKNITNGQPVLKDHLILFPRDGRGIMPDPKQKNGLIVMVRGEYELVNR